MKRILLSIAVVVTTALTLPACAPHPHRSARPDVAPRGSGVSHDAGVMNHGTSDMNNGGFQDSWTSLPPPAQPR